MKIERVVKSFYNENQDRNEPPQIRIGVAKEWKGETRKWRN